MTIASVRGDDGMSEDGSGEALPRSCFAACGSGGARFEERLLKASKWTWTPYIVAFSYAAASGIVGTQSVTLAKSLALILRGVANKVTKPSAKFEFDFFSVIVLAMWFASMAFWLYRRGIALKRFDATFIIPVLQVVWTLLSVVGPAAVMPV